MSKFYITTLMLASSLAAAAWAAAPAPAMDAGQAQRLIEDYFNNFTTLTAAFSQHASNDQWSHEGELAVKKPGQFVWKYETPHRQRIISTGAAVYYVDDEGGQVTQLPIQSGIGKLLGAREVHLDKLGFRVADVKQTPAQADITVVPVKADNQVKSVTLSFLTSGPDPLLTGISMVDGVGSTTQVTLSNIQTGVALDKKLFAFTPPQYRQN